MASNGTRSWLLSEGSPFGIGGDSEECSGSEESYVVGLGKIIRSNIMYRTILLEVDNLCSDWRTSLTKCIFV
jgi:hypothetical protein